MKPNPKPKIRNNSGQSETINRNVFISIILYCYKIKWNNSETIQKKQKPVEELVNRGWYTNEGILEKTKVMMEELRRSANQQTGSRLRGVC